ncbi:hypothetical protein OOZ19_09510 [Saccharopolyspora sp. NFXS83]|uniref:hypothetical protein n=1 Tax=Saccharopolyspora sp. NFXS83 TaxID=2993560 RepID=UPI00224A8AC5|nr:hypothetical protein [Saccharopolyspora sp. NFXS83]MCX2730478.1 hypothetical protein [Saccharopolyspora sp. NFXS83]
MRHDQSERSSAERERGPISHRPVAPALGDRAAPVGLIALQRTLGNAATAEWVRRSRERGRVEIASGGGPWAPVPADRHQRAAGATAHAVQRVETGAEPEAAVRPVRRGDVRERERALSEKCGIRIGPPQALASLPQGDSGPNEQLIAIEPDASGKHTSSYDADERTIGISSRIPRNGSRMPTRPTTTRNP